MGASLESSTQGMAVVMSPLAEEFLTFAKAWPWWKKLLFRRRYRQAWDEFLGRVVFRDGQ